MEANFSKLTDNNQIFRNDFDCIHYQLCKISSEIFECKIIAPYDFLEMNSILYGALTRDNSEGVEKSCFKRTLYFYLS